MDRFSEYIWERRIHHGVRCKKPGVHFSESVQLGLEFNAALEKMEKLDISLLTNAVVLELWEFAKCVIKSEALFLFEILEFNFDLGLDGMSETQYCDFRKEVHVKTKWMWNAIKTKQEKWKETFTLPQLAEEKDGSGSERQETNRNETFDVSLLTAGSKNTQSCENEKMQSEIIIKRRGRPPSKLTHISFPYCKELGVKMFIQEENKPKEKLHTDQLTKGVMMELLSFSRVLCGIRSGIVCDLVKLNFGQELSKVLLCSRVNRIMERKRLCNKDEDREALRKEMFLSEGKTQRKLQKRSNSDMDYQGVEELTVPSKRRSSLRESESDETEMCQDQDLSYMCPVDFEAEMLSDTETEQEKTMSVSGTSEMSAETTEEEMKLKAADEAAAEETQVVEEKISEEDVLDVVVKEEEEEVFVSSVPPQIKASDSQQPGVHRRNLSVSDLFSADKHQDQNVQTQKQRFWIRRTLRSQQILRSSRVTDRFASCRAIGLDFNVGAGSRQKLSLHLFTNGVMSEVHKFATCMQKSMHSFLSEILENNFHISFPDEAQQRSFTMTLVSKEKFYQSHPARRTAEFLDSPIQESSYTVDVENAFQTEEVLEDEQGEPDPETSPATEQEDSDLRPFCRKLGLDLWSTERRPASRKLDYHAVTKGAVMEIMDYIKYLCGNVRKTVTDVLEHNFDLDLRDPKSKDRRALEKWYCRYRNVMAKCQISKKKKMWLKELVCVSPTSENQHIPKPSAKDLTSGRKRNVKRPKSLYGTCEELGLHLSVGTKLKTRRKLHLGVLTRRVLFEIHQYTIRNSAQYIPALYQILENNFDLSSQNHRKVEFAWAVSSQVLGIARKAGRKGSYLDKAVELPLELSRVVCKEEVEDDFMELNRRENSDVAFVQELKPVDIEVEIE